MAGRPYDPKNPYVQQTPRFGGSVDLVPDESPITVEQMLLQEGMPLPKPKSRPVRRATAPDLVNGRDFYPLFDNLSMRASSEAERAFMNENLPINNAPAGTPEHRDNEWAISLERDRRQFKNTYDHERVDLVAEGQGWDQQTKNMIHGELSKLHKQDPGDWQLTLDAPDSVIFEDFDTGVSVLFNKNTGRYTWEWNE